MLIVAQVTKRFQRGILSIGGLPTGLRGVAVHDLIADQTVICGNFKEFAIDT